MSLAGQRADPNRYQVIPRTLIFGFRDGRVLLQQVAHGRGEWAGLWNGVGGHIEPGESAEAAARREFGEETGLTFADLRLAGTLLVDLGPSPGLGVYVFVGEVSDGMPRPNEEGEVRWFHPSEIESAPTVEDVPALLPHVLAARRGDEPFSAITSYDESGKLRIRFE